jgi:hydrogenase maturation protein HypF
MSTVSGTGSVARMLHISGVVQGVGFRPFVFRLARAHGLGGWVLNGDDGVRIHVEGAADAVDAFVLELRSTAPPAAQIGAIDVGSAVAGAFTDFEIRDSDSERRPITRIAPDLPICDACLRELCDARDRRYRYPYINCTNCGPRFSILRAMPYDRARTTMADWPLCPRCRAEYDDPEDRRFHAQPVACPACGPTYRLVTTGVDEVRGYDAIASAARLLCGGHIVAIKGIGGYHLACDADDHAAVMALRERKFRKEQAFAVMVRDVAAAERIAHLNDEARALLRSTARPIVLAAAREQLPGVAPDNGDVGIMLPYAPLHHLLFAAGVPERLVMTSGNRSSEPIAYRDDDAVARLSGLADALLIGDRPIARRVDDSVMRLGAMGPVVLRRSRGLAPAVVARLPSTGPILAVGGDLKNAITLVVAGDAYVSQHIGDVEHLAARESFEETIRDLLAMYAIDAADLTVVHDRHPDYASAAFAIAMGARRRVAVQHHRAHVASVLAERGAFDRRVVGIALDGTGHGDDGAIWGGEFFVGSIRDRFERVAHLRTALLAGGDAAARRPVQAAAGFVAQLDPPPDLTRAPFCFPGVYNDALALIRSGLRVYPTTSAGRLFDTVAALVGFTRPITFEGQAAMWLEHLARGAAADRFELPCRFTGTEIDWRDTLAAVVDARNRAVDPAIIARAFHRALARAIATAGVELAERANVDTLVLSGGVMQNDLLVGDTRDMCRGDRSVQVWMNQAVPPNDGGVSLGQAVIAAFASEPS